MSCLEPRLTINTNPLLEKLQDILAAQYRDKPNSRCIIFVRTRPVANALLSYLAEETRLLTFNLNAKLLTGANAKAEKLGKFFFNRHSFYLLGITDLLLIPRLLGFPFFF